MAITRIITPGVTDDAVTSDKINDNIISGTTALTSEPADTDELLVSDAGTLKRIDYSLIKSSPGRVLIKEIDANDVAAVTFVHGTSDVVFDTTYNKYELSFSNVKVAGDEQLNLRILSGGSVLTSGYASNQYGATNGSSAPDYRDAHFFETIGDLDAGQPFFGVAYFYNVGVSSSKPCSYGQYFMKRSTGTFNSRGYAGVYDSNISNFDGVTITNLGGPNIASGKFKLYGIS